MKSKTQLFLILFFIVNLFSCKKDLIQTNNTFELSVEYTNGRDFHLSWPITNLSDFENYIVVISTDSIPQGSLPQGSLPNAPYPVPPYVEIINDQETSFLDTTFIPYAQKHYFQVFAKFGDRFLTSNQVIIDIETIGQVATFPSQIFHDGDNQSIVIYNDLEDELTRYNYRTKSVELVLDIGLRTSGGVIGKYNGNSELYLIDETNTLNILDAQTFESKGNIPLGQFGVFSAATNDNGLIAMSIRDASRPVQFYSRENLELLDFIDFNGYNQSRGITFLSKNENKGIEISYLGIDYFQVNDDGVVIDNQSLHTNLSVLNFDKIVVSPSGNYFISTKEGIIYDKDLNYVGGLFENPVYSYSDYVFSEDETTLYALANQASFELSLIAYDFPSLEIKERMLLGFEPIKIFLENGEIFIVGRTFQGQQTIIQSVGF